MLKIIKSNVLFFTGVALFIVIAGAVLLNIEKGEAILYFSDHRAPFGDFFFKYFTKLGEEPIYIFFIGLFLFIRFRYAILVPVAGASALLISFALKSYFAHPRPFAFFTNNNFIDQLNLVDGVALYKAMTSFPSGHTTSAFAVFGIVALLYYKKPILGLVLFFFALLVGISRIYLVQHFLEDVYFGAILGTVIAMILFWLQAKIPYNENKWFDQSFMTLKKKDKV